MAANRTQSKAGKKTTTRKRAVSKAKASRAQKPTAATKKAVATSKSKGAAATRRRPVQGGTPSGFRQVGLLLSIMAMAFATVALISYNRNDPGLFRSHDGTTSNMAGPLGAWIADVLLYVLGYGACSVTILMVAFGLKLAGRDIGGPKRVFSGMVMLWACLCAVALVLPFSGDVDPFAKGGVIGETTAGVLLGMAGPAGAWIVTVTVFLSASTFLLRVNWQKLAEAFFQQVEIVLPWIGRHSVKAGRRTMGSMVEAGSSMVDKVKQVQWVEEYEEEYDEYPSGYEEPEVSDEPEFDYLPHGAPVDSQPERAPIAAARIEDFPAPFPGVISGGTAVMPRAVPSQPQAVPMGMVSDVPSDQTKVAECDLVEVQWEPTSAGVAVSQAVQVAAAPSAAPSLAPPPETHASPQSKQKARKPVVQEEPDFPFPAGLTGANVPSSAPVHRPGTASKPSSVERESPAPVADEQGAARDTWAEEARKSSAPKRPSVASEPVSNTPQPVRQPAKTAEESERDVRVIPGALESGGIHDDGGALISRPENTIFELPHLGLLDEHRKMVANVDEIELHALGARLEEKLADFGVKGEVTAIRPGPVITTFEYLPAPGIKISKIAGLSDDIAMALRAVRVRIVAPIPGKGVVGIEVPNRNRQIVWIRDMLASEAFRKNSEGLPLTLGKNVEGRAEIANLVKMPHLLVAGTTGSGKSVGINSMLLSMLFTRTPEELRMILIDPKMLEFEPYQDIPHLLHPVVTDPRLASAALKWACTEMDNRYRLLARWKTRDISSYNALVEKELEDWTPEKARRYAPRDWPSNEPPPMPTKLPYIVIVIDELADLMMAAAKDVEVSIARLAGKARAAGMHLIVATQRPEKNVVTGLIKANMPSRIAFQVRSKLDGRIILDQSGAEALLGKGDMLFLPPGVADLVRVHGPFVSDDEVRAITDFLREQGPPFYEAEIRIEDDDEPGLNEEDYDELYDLAVAFVVKKGKASTSMVQREFKIGYNRAARIVETMEREGVIGPADGARPREVLVGAC